jgi:hypothetical protein
MRLRSLTLSNKVPYTRGIGRQLYPKSAPWDRLRGLCHEGVMMTKPVASKQAWDARANLLSAAQMIDSASAWAEKDEEVYDRLNEFEWNGIVISLDELAAELRNAAEYIVADRPGFPIWQTEEHLCGYSVANEDEEYEYCYHEACWDEASRIVEAVELRKQLKDMTKLYEDKIAQLLSNWVFDLDADDKIEDVILVAFDVSGSDRVDMQDRIIELLVKRFNPYMNAKGIDSWWIAEDDRVDGSDNDSAIFVPMGAQALIRSMLRTAKTTVEGE